ncbi:DNA translocase FtsK [Clostridium sp. BJN0001]|uniref:FtsK/SpoIIIE family DNA translocase n=1 Tax=Clostridium sp. BJN0001 TaxID=2930219 RepID=UPI001FD199CE|nr:DNA translocase FtsK [Clostridium sp. BJN0001]
MSRARKAKTKTAEKKKSNKTNPDISGIIYMCVGIILSIAVYTSFAGVLSTLSQKLLFALLGVGAFALPLYLIYFGWQYIKTKGNILINKKFYGITLLIIVIMAAFATIDIQIAKNSKEEFQFFSHFLMLIKGETGNLAGGIALYIICYPLIRLIGVVGMYIVIFTLSLISLLLIFDITLYDLSIKFESKGRSLKEKNIKRKKNKKNKSYININDKTESSENNKTNDQKKKLLDGVDKKIQILDFMKENSDVEPLISKEQEENQKEENKEEEKSKDVMNKEIEEKIQHEKSDEKEYRFPDISLLNINKNTKLNSSDKKELIENADKLEEILSNFGVDAKVTQVTKGPSVTRFELQPSPGVKVSKIVNLSDDIALGLAASGIRIEAPIPGKAAVGIEVPNRKQTPVFLREVLENNEFINTNKKIAFALGKDISGKCVVGDLSKMPHTLIAGATGSGKSVCINSLIISILYKYRPDEVKLLMVDPKVVELNVYNGVPHLLIPVVTDPKKAAAALNWAVNEMTKRYKLFADMGVRNMQSYNELYEKGQIEKKLPYIVIIVDELSDLMMVCPNDVEDYIGRLAQMARAAGMHLVIATQRPSVDVITGVIKANIPSRISFAVSSQVDSRTILDSSGAEKLLGKGDMLYYPVGESKPLRVQGCFISEEEVEKVVSYIKEEEKENSYQSDIIDEINNNAMEMSKGKGKDSDMNEEDELLDEAINTVIDFNQASTSFIQRKLRIGFNRASNIMDELERRGIISKKDGSKPRNVLITRDQYENGDY